MLVEVCANSLQSALNAEKAGADRIELCAELGVGGITPSYGLIEVVKEQVKIPIHVLVRPRSGHFTYSKTEFEVLLRDIKFCKEIGVHGIVSGVLNTDNTLDIEGTKQILAHSAPLHFTFHRAFDWVSNPLETLEILENLGVDTILTSGQQSNALKGIGLLSQLHSKSKTITIMAGAGINGSNAEKFKGIGLKAIHLSGTEFENFISLDGKISMNSQKHLIEDQVAVTDAAKISQTLKSVK